ncbi:MAG TPA: hypothetical protein VGK59_20210 [Ohtaekwangia sp.]
MTAAKAPSILDFKLTEKQITLVELLIAVLFVSMPLLVQLPFRDNLYLSWEGAYRLYLGQMPYRDFGMPVGPGMWLVPALFFKIFGPYMFSLVKAQAFLNLLSIVCLRSVLKAFKLKPEVRLVSIVLFCLSYIMINFWPWYNQSVFVFQLVSLALILKGLFSEKKIAQLLLITGGSFFIVLALFTKQDGGAMALLNAGALVLVYSVLQKKILPILTLVVSFMVLFGVVLIPFLEYDFGYWFNYGQPPHSSRVSLMEMLNDWFLESHWLKFFFIASLFVIVGSYVKIARAELWNHLRTNIHETLLNVFILGILVQAAIIQVTSFSPAEGNYYFYTFGVAFLLHRLSAHYETSKVWVVVVAVITIGLWWSDNYWKYTSKVFQKFLAGSSDGRSSVTKYTWMPIDENADKYPLQLQHTWELSEFRTLKDIKIPPKTLEGIRSISKLDVWKKKDVRVLNVTELTFLAYEFNYVPEHNPWQPLWHHKHVGLFDREVQYLCDQISKETYDVILFEPIPYLRDYFANEIGACAREKYNLVARFPAPKVDTKSSIEVYIRK